MGACVSVGPVHDDGGVGMIRAPSHIFTSNRIVPITDDKYEIASSNKASDAAHTSILPSPPPHSQPVHPFGTEPISSELIRSFVTNTAHHLHPAHQQHQHQTKTRSASTAS